MEQRFLFLQKVVAIYQDNEMEKAVYSGSIKIQQRVKNLSRLCRYAYRSSEVYVFCVFGWMARNPTLPPGFFFTSE